MFHAFCHVNETIQDSVNDTSTLTMKDYVCDEYFSKNEPRSVRGVKGLASGIFQENVVNKFHDAGDAISSDEENEPEYNLGGLPKFGYVTTDIFTSFTLLVGIFFPSCTGTLILSSLSLSLSRYPWCNDPVCNSPTFSHFPVRKTSIKTSGVSTSKKS